MSAGAKHDWPKRIALAKSLAWAVGDRVTVTTKGDIDMRDGRTGVIRKAEFGPLSSSHVLLSIRWDDTKRGPLTKADASWFVPAPEVES